MKINTVVFSVLNSLESVCYDILNQAYSDKIKILRDFVQMLWRFILCVVSLISANHSFFGSQWDTSSHSKQYLSVVGNFFSALLTEFITSVLSNWYNQSLSDWSVRCSKGELLLEICYPILL